MLLQLQMQHGVDGLRQRFGLRLQARPKNTFDAHVTLTSQRCKTKVQPLTITAESIQCNVYVPKSAGTAALAAISESVIDGLTSVNAPDYTDTF